METEHELEDSSVTSCLYMVSAFLAMEPPETVLSFARIFGGGSLTESAQSRVWHRCVRTADLKFQGLYVKRFVKKLILEIESDGDIVMDELYEYYASCMISLQDGDANKGKVLKTITFLSPDESCGVNPRNLQIQLQSSVNMLEGDTGCSIWPSSLFLSEFILSFPDIFMKKCCLELGSGVGLVGMILSYVKASKVMLTDGDLATLANMKVNLELNQLGTSANLVDQKTVHCLCLPWESASEDDLSRLAPELILGADIIYDPSCLPLLVRVLALLLKRKSSSGKVISTDSELDTCQEKDTTCNDSANDEVLSHHSDKGPVAYIASVIRNVETFNCFIRLTQEANLDIADLTQKVEICNFLPHLKSYHRSSIRLFRITSAFN